MAKSTEQTEGYWKAMYDMLHRAVFGSVTINVPSWANYNQANPERIKQYLEDNSYIESNLNYKYLTKTFAPELYDELMENGIKILKERKEIENDGN